MNEKLTDNQLDEIFNSEKLDQAIRKSKQKATRKTILISILAAVFVVIIFSAGNTALTIIMSNKSYDKMAVHVKLTVPNGYISKSVDTFGLLGGRTDYTICRLLNGKPIILENQVRTFGVIPQLIMTRQRSADGHIAGQWPTNYWEYGYNRMIFFHPNITYKEYKNDLSDLSQISDDKVIELGLSLDKPYNISEISKILPDPNISWFWLDAFRSQDIEQYQKEAKEYDAKAAYISEYDALGVSIGYSLGMDNFPAQYNDFLFNLKAVQDSKYLEIYNELNKKGYTDALKIPILGVVVYGTKDQLNNLVNNPHIKASSFGVIADK
ncbi:MAG TPA: anti sigma factor C-terminal domain-containing protein [Desulfitobacteriaceae bacterium]|nr:anti sigma factor C-terminal domain-containing protein [Desulfitobacteriaceae bacterium]